MHRILRPGAEIEPPASTGAVGCAYHARTMPPGLLRFDTLTARLRAIAFVEGLSYLLLLLVAMPLKYLADLPLAVRIVGSAHGFLFIWLAWLTWSVMRRRGKSLGFGVRVGVAALIPFGTFFLDRELYEEDQALRRERGAARPEPLT